MASMTERERIAIDLKKWLRSQPRYKTIRELEKPTGIPYSSLKDYFQGRAAPVGERLRKLAELTHIPSLLQLVSPSVPRTTTSAQYDGKEAARVVVETVSKLTSQLDFFKTGTPADRALLRSALPARDVGYLTTLLKAMYDEDQFQTWVYFAEYKPESR